MNAYRLSGNGNGLLGTKYEPEIIGLPCHAEAFGIGFAVGLNIDIVVFAVKNVKTIGPLGFSVFLIATATKIPDVHRCIVTITQRPFEQAIRYGRL